MLINTLHIPFHSIAIHITRSSSVKKIKIVYLLEIKSAEYFARTVVDGGRGV